MILLHPITMATYNSNVMDTFDIQDLYMFNQMLKDEDWTSTRLQYLNPGFTITQKMLQYVKNVEKELDDISDWR